jgi:MarR family transcriptional regulator, organic hydroperoxide resistance regulator
MAATRKNNHTPSRAVNGGIKHQKMLEVLGQFRLVFKSIRRHYQKVQEQSGVNGAQLWALAHVAEHPGSKVGDLARALAIHPSTASNLINRLVALELVARKREGRDRRVVRLLATPRGSNALKRAPQPLIGVLQQALSDLPRGGLDGLHLHLGELIRTMKIKDASGRTTPLSGV